MNRYVALLVACISSNAAAERCMTVSVDHGVTDELGKSLLFVFDDRGQVQTIGPYRYTWKAGNIVRVDEVKPNGDVTMTWNYEYGKHGELLKVSEHSPSGTDKTWAEWSWTGTFGAKRSNAPKLYGKGVVNYVAPFAGPMDARGPDAIFTGDVVWPRQLTQHYDEGSVTSSDGYHGTKTAFTYDSKQHLVKSVETVLSGAEEIRHYRYDGDRLVHEDDKLGTDEARSDDYSYDGEGRTVKRVALRGSKIEYTYTYNYDCPVK